MTTNVDRKFGQNSLAPWTDLLACPNCGGAFKNTQDTLECVRCGKNIPVEDGIPRFIRQPPDATARRTQASFGYEWTQFADWKPSGDTIFAQYFGDLDDESLKGLTVLDAGCGIGRHARHIALRAERLIAMDFSAAIDQAAHNTTDFPNVQCVQGDVLASPVRDDAFDLVYSLGVLHHLSDPETAIRSLVRKVKPNGRLRVYLYWKRQGLSSIALKVVGMVRRITTRLPFGLLKALCWPLSIIVYTFVVVPYRGLDAIGIRRHRHWPLYVYAPYPFRVLYNDQFDRFSAPLEKRYDADEVKQMLQRAGLCDVRVWASFGWMAEGIRPPCVE